MYKHEHYPDVPDRTLDSLDRWAQNGLPPGSFGMAVLTNDLQGAVASADSENQRHLADIIKYAYNELPMACWGSEERVNKWMEEVEASEDLKSSGV